MLRNAVISAYQLLDVSNSFVPISYSNFTNAMLWNLVNKLVGKHKQTVLQINTTVFGHGLVTMDTHAMGVVYFFASYTCRPVP